MSTRSWLIIRNVITEGPGLIGQALCDAAVPCHTIDAFGTEPLPTDPSGLAGLVVLGGPMGVYEATRHPALVTQQRLISAAVATGLPVLGICLGAQLMASAFGARVFPGPGKEIGWSPLELTDAGALDPVMAPLAGAPAVFHLHSDTFDIPAAATHLARSALYPMQAFRIGSRAYGLQFHLEFTVETIDAVLDDPACQVDLAALGSSPAAIRSDSAERVRTLEPIARQVFDNFLTLG